jgi:hypothetical protein
MKLIFENNNQLLLNSIYMNEEEDYWELTLTASYILQQGHKSAALQFPDELLSHSSRVANLLQRRVGSHCQIYILAVCTICIMLYPKREVTKPIFTHSSNKAHSCTQDTTYNPLAVDEVAAMHVGASCVVRPS